MRFCLKEPGTDSKGDPRPMLAVVLLIQLYLFAGVHWDRAQAIARLDDPRAQSGEGLVTRCDGLGYYAWLRSLLVDGDLSFDDEFDDHNPLGDFVPSAASRTEADRRANPWSVGPACLWATTVIPGHFVLRALSVFGLPWPADGYSLPYQLLVGLTSLAVSCVGLAFLYRICRHFASALPAALAASCLTLGTTLVYYNALEVSMAHGMAAAVLAGFVSYWLKTLGSVRSRRWLIAGMLLGMATLMRWQLAAFAVLLVGEALFTSSLGRFFQRLLPAAIGAAFAFSPQFLAWQIVYGRWVAHPITIVPNWLHPAWRQILFDADRGLFYWTPLTLLLLPAALALAFARDRIGEEPTAVSIGRRLPARLLLAAFGLQVYLLAVCWGPNVYLGAAYGMRHLTESLLALAPGLAWLVDRSGTKAFRVLVLGILALVLSNLMLVSLYRHGWIPASGRLDPRSLPALCVHLVERKKLLLVGQVLAGPLALGFLALKRGARTSPDALPFGSSRLRAPARTPPALQGASG
jgi:hypothetical protein